MPGLATEVLAGPVIERSRPRQRRSAKDASAALACSSLSFFISRRPFQTSGTNSCLKRSPCRKNRANTTCLKWEGWPCWPDHGERHSQQRAIFHCVHQVRFVCNLPAAMPRDWSLR